MKKTAVYLAIVMILTCISVPAAAYDSVFSDVPADAWEAPYVYDLVERGIVSGYGDGSFGPRLTVQRCEYAKMLVGITGTPVVDSSVSPYADVPREEWYFPYINSSLNFITGYSENGVLTFRPEWDATREVVTTALVKALGVDISKYEDPTAFLSEKFWDVDSIAVHNRAYIAAAVDKGYITGDEGGSFRGQDSIIRAEVVAILCRAFPKNDVHNIVAENKAVSGVLTASFLDVGQGDSCFLELPGGRTMLIDAGTAKYGSEIVSFIKGRGYSHLDYIVATHPHADHIGGMTEVLNNFSVGGFYLPSAVSTSKTYEKMLDTLDEKDIDVIPAFADAEIYGIPGVSAVFVSPIGDTDDLNNASAVLRLSFGEVDFLFTGDAEAEAESAMLQSGVRLDAEVLKVGHHGSATSSSGEFLSAVKPVYAVISCGAGNSYGHPSQQTLDALSSSGAEIRRTDTEGTVTAVTDGKTITIGI